MAAMLRNATHKFLVFLRLAAFYLLDTACLLVPARRQRTAVILRLDAIGDFFIWMQSGAHDLVQFARNEAGRTVLVANAAWAEYARGLQIWDDVIVLDPRKFVRNPLYRVGRMLRIRRLGAELLIQPRAARIFVQEDMIVRVAGAKTKIGSAGTGINTTPSLQKLGDRYYDRLIDVSQEKDLHETVRNAEFLTALTGARPTNYNWERVHSGQSGDYIAVVVGAGQIGRVWPLQKLAALIHDARAKHPDLRFVLLGAPADRSLAERLRALVPYAENHVGHTTLREYVDYIASARLVICNDTSAYHIAMALDRNVICFLGGGHFGWFGPYPATHVRAASAKVLYVKMDCYWCNWKCRYPRSPEGALACVDAISLDDGIRAVDAVLRS